MRGETGIRTPDTLLTYTRFPGVPLQPLEHLSFTSFHVVLTAHNVVLHFFSYKNIYFFCDYGHFRKKTFMFPLILCKKG